MVDFSLSEFECPCGNCENRVKLVLLNKLQLVRDFIREPIRISSGYRCANYNLTIGGSPTSSHLLGLAADIKIPDNIYRYKLIEAVVYTKAFYRYGTGDKNGTKIFHLDYDLDKPQGIVCGY